MKKYVLVLCCFLYGSMVYAQNINVSGRVVDERGDAVIGAAVVVKGTAMGVNTDINGDYNISAPADAVLVFSFMGMTPKEENVDGRSQIDVVLSENTQQLDEVVVVGYGSQKAKDLTAPIAVVKGDDLARTIAGNAASALQGKVAGVQIINNGAPGAGATVKVRGVGSIGDYAKPLYIIDGMFVENIDFLSANDIETMNVLKDASAASIYGVRAANGVILITTKKGSGTKPRITYDGYAGVQIPVNIMPLADRDQYIELLNLANIGTANYTPRSAADYPASTDWYSQLLRPAAMHSHSIDISGMTENTNYSVGLSYLMQDGTMNAENYYERINLRGRFEQKVAKWLKVGVNTIISTTGKQNPQVDAFQTAYVSPPVYPVYNEENVNAYPIKYDAPQRYGYGNSYGNPVARAHYLQDNTEGGRKFIFSTFAEFNIIEDKLTFKTSYNQDYTSLEKKVYQPEYYVGGSQGRSKSILTKTFENRTMQILDNTLTYTDRRGAHDFNILLGQSTRMERMSNLWGSALDVPNIDDAGMYLTTGSYKIIDRETNDGGSRYNGLSAFARAAYNYAGRYLATITFRTDASSKYQQKWGYFPSIGLGWVLTQESFMKNSKVFDFLKIRASWGLLGNDNIPANSSSVTGSKGVGSSGLFGENLVDGQGAQTVTRNYLKWEVVSEYNVGADMRFLNSRLSAEVDAYYRITDNVVFSAPISSGGGTTELLANNGKVLNAGVELTINWADKISDKLSYSIGANATTIHNRVLELTGRDFIPGASVSGGFATRTAVGHPIGAFYGYEVEGVHQSLREALMDGLSVDERYYKGGTFKYKNTDGQPGITENDKVYLGSPIPYLIFGADFGLNYGGFDFSLALQGQVGNKIFNSKRMNRNSFPDGNYDLDFYNNAWREDARSSEYPSPAAFNSGQVQQPSSFFVEDGSYIRIQNVQAGYTFTKIPKVSLLRVFVSAQRPLTLFNYNGFTTEVSGSPIATGIDGSVYPMSAVYSVGAKITF